MTHGQEQLCQCERARLHLFQVACEVADYLSEYVSLDGHKVSLPVGQQVKTSILDLIDAVMTYRLVRR